MPHGQGLHASQDQELTQGLASEPFSGPTNVRFWGGYHLRVVVAGNLWVYFIGKSFPNSLL